MWSHPLGVLITKTKSSYQIYICLELFVFLFLLFQAWALDRHRGHHHHHDLHPFAPPLGMYTNLSHDHLEQRLAHRVSSIHQNQTRAFMTTPSASNAVIWTSHALLMLTGATNLVYTGSQGAKLENPLKSVHSRSSLVGTLVPHQRHLVSANQHHQVPFCPQLCKCVDFQMFCQTSKPWVSIFLSVFSKPFFACYSPCH